MYDLFNKRRMLKSSRINSSFISVDPWILAASFFSRYMLRASVFDLLCTYFSPSYKFKSNLDKILKEHEIEILQCENAWTIPPSIKSGRANNIPVIATLHDVLSERMPQLCHNLKTPKVLAKKLISKTTDFELKAIDSTDLNACVSKEDVKRFVSFGVNPNKFTIIPNGVDTKLFHPRERDYDLIYKLKLSKVDPIILFSGSDMYQNRIAVNDLIAKVLPNLIMKKRNAKILILGTIGKYVNKLQQKNPSLSKYVISLGFVEDISSFYSITDAVILPLNFGTGTKLKTLEAMAAGKVIISTRLGAQGIPVENKKTMIIEDTLEKYGEHIVKVTEDYEYRRELEINARKTACSYDWNKVFKKYNQIYSRFS